GSATAGAARSRLVLHLVFTARGASVSLQYGVFSAFDRDRVAAGALQAYLSQRDPCILVGDETCTSARSPGNERTRREDRRIDRIRLHHGSAVGPRWYRRHFGWRFRRDGCPGF